MLDDEDIDVVGVRAWQWQCGECGDSGPLELDPSSAQDGADAHVCRQVNA